MNSKLKTQELLVKPVITAVVGTVALSQITGVPLNNTMNLFGYDVPFWLLSGGLGYAASMGSELVHAFIYPDTEKGADWKSTATSLGLNAGANLLLFELAAQGKAGSPMPYIESAVLAQAVSDYGYRFVSPWLQ